MRFFTLALALLAATHTSALPVDAPECCGCLGGQCGRLITAKSEPLPMQQAP